MLPALPTTVRDDLLFFQLTDEEQQIVRWWFALNLPVEHRAFSKWVRSTSLYHPHPGLRYRLKPDD